MKVGGIDGRRSPQQAWLGLGLKGTDVITDPPSHDLPFG